MVIGIILGLMGLGALAGTFTGIGTGAGGIQGAISGANILGNLFSAGGYLLAGNPAAALGAMGGLTAEHIAAGVEWDPSVVGEWSPDVVQDLSWDILGIGATITASYLIPLISGSGGLLTGIMAGRMFSNYQNDIVDAIQDISPEYIPSEYNLYGRFGATGSSSRFTWDDPSGEEIISIGYTTAEHLDFEGIFLDQEDEDIPA